MEGNGREAGKRGRQSRQREKLVATLPNFPAADTTSLLPRDFIFSSFHHSCDFNFPGSQRQRRHLQVYICEVLNSRISRCTYFFELDLPSGSLWISSRIVVKKESFKGVWQRRISFSLIAGDLFDFELEFNCPLAENFVSSMINSVSIVSRCSFRSNFIIFGRLRIWIN